MANVKAPSLRYHKGTGQWLCQWGGKHHYLGQDAALARERYQAQLDAWTAWRAERASGPAAAAPRNIPSKRGDSGTVAPPPRPPASAGPTAEQVAQKLFALVDSESGPAGRQNVRDRLVLFLKMFGPCRMSSLTPSDLLRYKSSLAGYAPATTNGQPCSPGFAPMLP
jgi:hypothetical protein